MRTFIIRMVLAVAGIFLVVAAVAAARFFGSHRLPSHSFGLSGYAAAERIDVAFIGSSRSRQGYDARVLEASGCVPWLVSYNGLTPVLQEIVVADLLTRRRAPDLLVLEAFPYGLLRMPAVQDTRLFLQLSPQAKAMLLAAMYQAGGGFDWRDAFMLLVRTDNEMVVTYPLVRPALEQGSYRGAHTEGLARRLADFDDLALPADLAGPDDIAFVRIQEDAVRRVIRLLQRSGIRFVHVEMPIPAPLRNIPMSRRAHERYRKLVEESGEVYLDGAQLVDTNRPELFADATHLSDRGRAAFSEAFARATLAGGRLTQCGPPAPQ